MNESKGFTLPARGMSVVVKPTSRQQHTPKARQELESKTGKKVVSGENYLPPVTRKKLLKK